MSLQILIVDDEPSVRLSLSRLLERFGCIAYQASNGVEAEKVILEAEPDLVLLDIMMPVQDGYQTCINLRRNDFRGIVIMVSALPPHTAQQLAVDCGADEYLQKPVHRETLAAWIGKLSPQSV